MAKPTVTASNDDTPELPDGVYGWDWSQTTHALDVEGLHEIGAKDRQEAQAFTARQLVRTLDPASVLPGKGMQGWPMSIEAYDAEGYLLGSVYYGGSRDDVHVKSTSEAADRVRELVQADSRTARVDTRVDTLTDFDQLLAIAREASGIYGSKLSGWWSEEGGESTGRTIYLGAPSSMIRVRFYEKWLESPGLYVEGTNRVEVQLRPPTATKGRVSQWSRAETFCASKTTRTLAAALGSELVPAPKLRIARGTPELERTLEVMGQQYGPAVARWLEVSGGDIGKVLHYLTGSDDE